MTVFHLGNCVALSYFPYFITYKYSGLAEYSTAWMSGQAALAYFATQLCKLLILATFFPTSEHEGENFDFIIELFKCSVNIVDLIGLHLMITRGLSGKGEVKFLAGGLGWAAAELVATRIVPLWVGARGTEFNWTYIQMSLESNVNLVHYLALAAVIWLWNRSDLKGKLNLPLLALLAYAVYREFIYMLLQHSFHILSWSLLSVKAFLTIGYAILAINLYNVASRKKESFFKN